MPTNDAIAGPHGASCSAPLRHWCDQCGEPITADDPGWIKTDPDAIAERRSLLSSWFARHPTYRRTPESRAAYPRAVAWMTVHTACDPRPEITTHAFGVGRARTERNLLELCAKISQKRWAVHTDWAAFIRKTLAANALAAVTEADL